jgi:hypothetical protein
MPTNVGAVYELISWSSFSREIGWEAQSGLGQKSQIRFLEIERPSLAVLPPIKSQPT